MRGRAAIDSRNYNRILMQPVVARRAAVWFRRVLLLAGAGATAVMLWKLDAHAVGRAIANAGWGIPFLIALAIVPELLHSTGWRFAFTPAASKSYGAGELLKLWVAGEGVNYLVPTATIAGEVTRVAMLNDSQPAEVRAAAVVAARINGTIGQISYLLAGFAFLLPRLSFMKQHGWIATTAGILLLVLMLSVITYATWGWRKIAVTQVTTAQRVRLLRAIPDRLRAYYGAYRGRFVVSTLAFATAYAWGAVEAFFICRFIGVPVSFATALSIEVLSVTIDGVLFLVPAKVGTQELGKTAIFSMLALPLSAGFAFGVIRHIRELVWAIVGFAFYARGERSGESAAVR